MLKNSYSSIRDLFASNVIFQQHGKVIEENAQISVNFKF